jgi:hypothetical protein
LTPYYRHSPLTDAPVSQLLVVLADEVHNVVDKLFFTDVIALIASDQLTLKP